MSMSVLTVNRDMANAYNDSMSKDMLDNMSVRLLLLMRDQHLSGKELARQIGVTPSFISQILEQGKSPSVGNLRKLADALHTTMDYLACRSNVPYAENEEVRAYSPEGDESARIVDELSPTARATVMAHLRLFAQEQDDVSDMARESMAQFVAQIRAGGLVLTEREIGAIAAFVRNLTGIDVTLPAAGGHERTRG